MRYSTLSALLGATVLLCAPAQAQLQTQPQWRAQAQAQMPVWAPPLGKSVYVNQFRAKDNSAAAIAFTYFMTVKSPTLGENDEAVWSNLLALQDCTAWDSFAENHTAEFGDRAKAKQALATTMAATKQLRVPPMMDVYFRGKLKTFDADKGGFAVEGDISFGSFPTNSLAYSSFNAYLSAEAAGRGGNEDYLQDVPLRLWIENDVVTAVSTSYGNNKQGSLIVCPTSKGGARDQLLVTYWLDVSKPAQTLPLLKMDAAKAQAFIAANPERKVILKTTIVPISPVYGPPPGTSSHPSHYSNYVKEGSLLSFKVYSTKGELLQ